MITLFAYFIRRYLEVLTGGTVTTGTFIMITPFHVIITWEGFFAMVVNGVFSVITGLAGVYAAYKFKKYLEKQDNEKSNKDRSKSG